jgi:mono/diheme cytochrome c family protein
MKALHFFTGAIALVLSHSVLAHEQDKTETELEVRTAPLGWKQARLTDGRELFIALCAACHGKEGKADGPVAPVLKKTVPDLTLLAITNNGIFPEQQVEDSIVGKSNVVSHGTIDMPVWGPAFEGVRPDWQLFRREALARQRIHNLVGYIETIQAE